MKFKRAMLVLILIVICIGSTNSMSIGSVSDKNVTKRVARASNNLLPDWVQFKNKNGEELGEFVQVEQKSKSKKRKRLALPTNFVLKAVAEPQDDYYDKGQGEGDGGGEGDDYYEKKEWSDVYRDGQDIKNNTLKTKLSNHTDLSDIDGVVNIITKANPIDKIIDQQKIRKGDKKTVKDKKEKENLENKTVLETKENSGENDSPQQKVDPKEEYVKEQEYDKEVQTPQESKKQVTKAQKDDDTEYDESSEKRQTESEEKKENEAKKAKILNSVDELKQRHADEQREISERLKEEELQLEQYENDKISGKKEAKQQWKAYETPTSKEDSEDKFVLNDKYKINPPKRTTTATTTKSSRKKSRKRINKDEEEGKLSVFKNPKQYLIYDEETGEVRTTTAKPKKTKKSRRPNPSTVKMEKLSTVPTLASEESVHISLVPDANSKQGEPSLFFPKRRKSKRKRNKNKASTPATDSSAAETTDKKSKKDVVALGVKKLEKAVSAETGLSALESAPSALESAPSALESTPSALESASSAQEAVSDAVPASTHHEKKDEGPKNYHREKGGARDYHSEHEEEHGEHGKKAYEVYMPLLKMRRDQKQDTEKKPKSWASTKIRRPLKGTKTKKTTSANMMIMEDTTSITTMKPDITVHIITKNMAKNMQSMKNLENTQRDTTLKEVTTSTKKKNTKRKSNSLKKTAIQTKKRNTAVTIMSANIPPEGTLRRKASKLATTSMPMEKLDTSEREDMSMSIRAINRRRAMMGTANTGTKGTADTVKTRARNGSTTMDIPRRLQISYESIDG